MFYLATNDSLVVLPGNEQDLCHENMHPDNCAKISFLSQTQKLRSNNKICFDENDCSETLVFSWTYWDLVRTNKTPEFVHFIWRYIHETSKALYYVFEFKCSKVLRIMKSGLGPCLSYKILKIFLLKQQYHALDPQAQNINFYRGNPLDSSKKLNIINFSLSFPCF